MTSTGPTDTPGARLSDGTEGTVPTPDVLASWDESYAEWAGHVAQPRPVGHETVPTQSQPLNWTPLPRPLSECTVALVSTGGVHLRTQEPFDVFAEEGDWSPREIPGNVETADLTVTHTHYAVDDAMQDINVMFPLDRLRELTDEGAIGAVSPIHFGLMGFIPDPALLLSETAPAMARKLVDHGVDVVALTGG